MTKKWRKCLDKGGISEAILTDLSKAFDCILDNLLVAIIEYDIASYADDNTPYNFDFNLDNVISNLEKSTNSLLNWFRENHMKANADKCHLLVSSDESCTAKIEDFLLKIAPKKNCYG